MVRMISQVGGGTCRNIAVAAMITTLAACSSSGSGSGDTDTESTVDLNGDGVIDALDIDTDADGIADVDDIFTDSNFDGIDDFTGLTEAESIAGVDGSVVPGDEDNDGFVDVSSDNVCGSESGLDNDSSTATWGDNCVVRRSGEEDENGRDLDGLGQFADSFYAVAIQRVAFCTGFGTGTDYTVFADGEYGPASEAALIAFQQDENLVDDGIVGPQTWSRLQSRIELLATGTVGDSDPDTFGFTTGPCADIPMFYQFTSVSPDGLGFVGEGWELARNEPNADQRVPFSIALPFNQL